MSQRPANERPGSERRALPFVAFNILEAALFAGTPYGPAYRKRRGPGCIQLVAGAGLSAGGVFGEILVTYTVREVAFVFGAAMMLLWFIAAFSMREPRNAGSANSLVGELKHGLSQ